MKELVAVVLAGGSGSRFWPLSTDKILYPFFGKPLVHYSVETVLPKQVQRAVIVANASNKGYFDNLRLPVPSTVVVQPEATGMAQALLCAEPYLHGASMLILIADDLLSPGLFESVIDEAQRSGAFGVMPGLEVSSYFPGGYLSVDGQRITSIVEKPGEGNEPSSYVNISGHFIGDADMLLSAIKQAAADRDDQYEQALCALMSAQEFRMIRYAGDFASLKYPWHILDIQEKLFARVLPQPYIGEHCDIKSSVVIEGNVYISDHVRIFEQTKITGPCYIGPHTIIGNNNIIRHSSIGAHCVTGFNTDITRSYIGDHCWFHTNYIGDSILEGNISMGSGAVVANLRLDEQGIGSVVKGQKVKTGRNKLGSVIGKDVRIGVNASIMPGIKIGARSFVGAGVVLAQDLPHDSFCLLKQEHVITTNTRHADPGARDAFRTKL